MTEEQPNPQFWNKFLAPTLAAHLRTSRLKSTEESSSSSSSDSDEAEEARPMKVARVGRDSSTVSLAPVVVSGKRPPTTRPNRSEQVKAEIRRALETRGRTKQRKLALDDTVEEIGDRQLLYKDQEREAELMRLRQPCAMRLTSMTRLVGAFLAPSGDDTRRPLELSRLPALMTQLDEKQLFLSIAQGALTVEAGVLCHRGMDYACIVGRDGTNPNTLVFYIVQRI